MSSSPRTPRSRKRIVTRRFGDLFFHFVEPGFWRTIDGHVLREEFSDGKESRANHSWVAEHRCGDEIIQHYGIGLTIKEAARHLPNER